MHSSGPPKRKVLVKRKHLQLGGLVPSRGVTFIIQHQRPKFFFISVRKYALATLTQRDVKEQGEHNSRPDDSIANQQGKRVELLLLRRIGFRGPFGTKHPGQCAQGQRSIFGRASFVDILETAAQLQIQFWVVKVPGHAHFFSPSVSKFGLPIALEITSIGKRIARKNREFFLSDY